VIIRDASVTRFKKNDSQTYNFTVNAYWITIKKGSVEVLSRDPREDTWMDDKHFRITKALKELEEALIMAVEEEK
jgi:hypothetical protein